MSTATLPVERAPALASVAVSAGSAEATQQRRERRFDWLWFAAWMLGSAVFCLTTVNLLGATFDEPFYLEAGLQGWRDWTHYQLLRQGTMPLPVDLVTLPIYVWELISGTQFELPRDLYIVLPWARAMTLVFWFLLLFYGRLIGRQLGGPWGGRLAVALLACEPSLLAHASLATTDIAISACLLGFLYHFRVGRERSWGWRIVLPGIWLGLSILAKASALVFCVLGMWVLEFERLTRDGRLAVLTGTLRARLASAWLQLRPFLFDTVKIGLVGLVVALVFCGSDWKPEPTFIAWAQSLPEGWQKNTALAVSENLCIFNNALVGIARQIKHNIQGHGSYIVGQTAPRAIWYYFPLVILIKLSLPLLFVTAAMLLTQPKRMMNWAFLLAMVLMAFSITYRVQIGIRLILPVVALGIVGLAAALARTAQSEKRWQRVPAIAVSVLLVAWAVIVPIRVWPHTLCYTNLAWGDTKDGYYHVSEANYDWGQGIKELRQWQEQNDINNVDLWYFGTDNNCLKLPGIRMVFPHVKEQAFKNSDEFVNHVRGRYLAVGTTILYGPYVSMDVVPMKLLHEMEPVDRTQTFLIYDFTDTDHFARTK